MVGHSHTSFQQKAASTVPSWVHVTFVTAAFAALLVPLLGMPFDHGDTDAEKRDLAAWPSLAVDGKPNVSYLQEAGSYFEDHFALRTRLVDLDATLKERVFGTSSTTNVVVGTDGWLYYAGTLDNYQRVNQMSDQSLSNAAFNIALMQEHVRALGKTFTITICPNKNSIYPEHMPYYLPQGPGESDLDRLEPLLEARHVNYVDMGEVMKSQDGVMYYARDSHWNEEGALAGYNALLDAIGRPHETYSGKLSRKRDRHVGDIERMLHPTMTSIEEGPHFRGSERFVYKNDATSVEDAFTITESTDPAATGVLMLYRDSFGNNLMPYLATAYKIGVFTKRIPYDMSEQALRGVHDVMVERVERHLSFFASDPPYMPAPQREIGKVSERRETATTLSASRNGMYLTLEGDLDPAFVHEDSRYYVRLDYGDGVYRTYEAFHVSPPVSEGYDYEEADSDETRGVTTDFGYRAYVADGADATRVSVIVESSGTFEVVYEGEISVGQ